MDVKRFIAQRVAKELRHGDVVNLGIGLPTLVADYVPEGVEVVLQAEHGILGSARRPSRAGRTGYHQRGGFHITVLPARASSTAPRPSASSAAGTSTSPFSAHCRLTKGQPRQLVMVPGKKVTGMGGAMDLVVARAGHRRHGAYEQRRAENP